MCNPSSGDPETAQKEDASSKMYGFPAIRYVAEALVKRLHASHHPALPVIQAHGGTLGALSLFHKKSGESRDKETSASMLAHLPVSEAAEELPSKLSGHIPSQSL